MRDTLIIEPIDDAYESSVIVRLPSAVRLALIAEAAERRMPLTEWMTAKLGGRLGLDQRAVDHIRDIASAVRQHAVLMEDMPEDDAVPALRRMYGALENHYERLASLIDAREPLLTIT